MFRNLLLALMWWFLVYVQFRGWFFYTIHSDSQRMSTIVSCTFLQQWALRCLPARSIQASFVSFIMMALGIIQNHTLSVQGLPLQKHHGSLLGFSILYCVNFLATSFPAIRCWEVANCHWIYHQICQDWGPITNMKLLMVAFPCFSWTSNYQYISYVCFPHKSALSG